MGNIIHKLELTNKKLKCLKKTDEGMFLYNFRSFQKKRRKEGDRMRHDHLDTRSHDAVLNNRFGLQIGRSRFAPVSPQWKPRGAFLVGALTWMQIYRYNYQRNLKILDNCEGTLVLVLQ